LKAYNSFINRASLIGWMRYTLTKVFYHLSPQES